MFVAAVINNVLITAVDFVPQLNNNFQLQVLARSKVLYIQHLPALLQIIARCNYQILMRRNIHKNMAITARLSTSKVIKLSIAPVINTVLII